MKNISNMLYRGNLTPKEKFLLLIHNDVNKTKTGKEVLTPADKEALENWKAQNNSEAHEWNQLNEGWKYTGRMEIEAEFAYKDAQISHLANLPIIVKLLYYPSYHQMGGYIESLKKIKKVTLEEATKIVTKQKEVKLKDGLDFDYAIYKLAFEISSEEDKKRFNKLYGDVETDHQYLDQEEVIASLYDGKDELSQEAKEKLAKLVSEQSYNKFAKEHQLFHYFACIPLLEVAKYFLKSHGIEILGNPMSKNQEAQDGDLETFEDVTETMKKYADEHGTTIKAMLYEGCLKYLDHGLLDDYTPLAVSNDAELLKRWFKTKIKAQKILREHIQSGELELRHRTDDESRKDKLFSKGQYDSELESARMVMENVELEIPHNGELDEKIAFETFNNDVITGESLYSFKGDYEFIKDFKERTDKYDANLGIVYSDDDPEHRGEHLDRELLICDLDNKGEPCAFSVYGMSVRILSNLFKGKVFFEEFKEDEKIFIKFIDEKMDEVFRERQKNLIDGYASLLAFEVVLKKVSKIYEVDMTEHVISRMMVLLEYMTQSNNAVRMATNTDEEFKKTESAFFRRKEILQFKNDLIIDIGSIKPDEKIIEEQEKKLKEIFPDL